MFDADFVPESDFLRRTVPRFFDESGMPQHDLALVQAQWAHLNATDSILTLAQSLWIDDHHTVGGARLEPSDAHRALPSDAQSAPCN